MEVEVSGGLASSRIAGRQLHGPRIERPLPLGENLTRPGDTFWLNHDTPNLVQLFERWSHSAKEFWPNKKGRLLFELGGYGVVAK